MQEQFILSNQLSIPSIGFGTWQTPNGDVAISSVKYAIESGYTHIDTAAIYGNEKSIGQAIKESGVAREKLFITSKVWNSDRGYESTKKAFAKTLNDLQLDYLDLYLIHWPANSKQFTNWQSINAETWRALEDLYKEGYIKAIGVSNFMVNHLQALLKTAEIAPMVNQIEFHPGHRQAEVVELCQQNNILVQAWSPLGTGKMLTNSMLVQIAAKYNKSVAQLCVRWCLQNGTLPLPKSVTPSRIDENKLVFDFEISAADMQTINQMPYCGGSGLDPDQVDF